MISIPFGTVLGLARSRLYANPKSTTRCDAATSLPFTKAEAFLASEETYLSLPSSFRRISSRSLPLPFVSNNVINVIYKIERCEITSIFFFFDLETFEKEGKGREGTENIGSSGITMRLIRLYCCVRSVVTHDFSE